jgi:choline-sulfatase
MADQMAAPLMPLYDPASTMKLPNLQRLARDAVVFDSAYCNSPLCAPSRYALMTGQLPSRIGAYDNAAELPASIPTFAHYLRNLGYRTALAGKMHFCGPDQLHGFEERLTTDIYPADFGWAVNWDEPQQRPSWYHNMSSVLNAGPCVRSNQLDFDDEVLFKARQFLFDQVRGGDERPFCLTVSLTHPHDPYSIGRAFWDLYQDERIPLPRLSIPQQKQDPHSQRLLKVIDLWGKRLPEERIRAARRAYFGACSYVDEIIGQLLRTLADCGLADDTLILFSGDHGDMLGERGLWYKMHWFEMSARVPLLIHAPGRFAARRVGQNVSTLDLLPTLVELAGGRVHPQLPMDGRSLLPRLQGIGGHDEVLGEYMAEGSQAPIVMIRRGDYKLIYSEQDPPLLFDIKADPLERNNLALVGAQQQRLAELIGDVRRRWSLDELRLDVLASQRRRRLVGGALGKGARTFWDHQPRTDAAQQYIRNHIDLDELERRARYPAPD